VLINRTAWITFLVLSAVVAFIYLPGIDGAFNFDDDANIIANPTLRVDELSATALIEAANSGIAGPLGRPVAMVSFALNHYFSGEMNPRAMKFTNLLIHLFTGFTIFLLTHLLTSRILAARTINAENPQLILKWTPLLVAIFWMVHPANLTPVLYVVQRMTSLSALFCVIGMSTYVYGREQQLKGLSSGWPAIAVSYLICLPLAAYSKENGVLLPLYLLIIELAFFQFYVAVLPGSQQPRQQQLLLLMHTLLCLLPGLLIAIYLAINPDYILHSYGNRSFDLGERLYTESRVLFLYLKFVFRPLISEMALFHDYFEVSRSLFAPISTLFAVGGLITLTLSAILAWRGFPLYFFVVIFFLAAHSIESSLLGLELIHEHRNYLASWPLIFIPSLYLVAQLEIPRRRPLILLIIFLLGLVLSFQTWQRATIWGNQIHHALDEVINHPSSARANYQAGRVYAFLAYAETNPEVKGQYIESVLTYFRASAKLDKTGMDATFGILMLHAVEGVAVEQSWRSAFLARLRVPPFAPNNYNYLQSMFKCIADGECVFAPDLIGEIMSAVNSNPQFRGEPAKILRQAHAYYLRKSADA
jgi:hypothetical protein